MLKVLKICCNDWKNASRDKRELSVCRELGMNVQVLAKGSTDDRGRIEEVDGYEVRRYTTRSFSKLPNSINRILSLFIWAKYAKKLKADIISGHDLSGLTVGWISTWFMPKNKKPKLIYDSHEFELGRNKKRSRLQVRLIKLHEHAMIKKSSMVMMVNDCIADEVQKIYRLKERPVVVRNIPEKWEVDEDVCKLIRAEILSAMPKGVKLLLMYHGLVTSGRGLEKIIEAVGHFENVGLFILGDVLTKQYKEKLLDLVDKFHISERVIMRDSVPQNELWKYIGAADIGAVILEPISASYYYCLPNKFFENIQAETPVIVTNLPEIAGIVRKYDIGWIAENSVDSIVDCIDRILEDMNSVESKKKNTKKAKEQFCWEKEKEVLKAAYRKFVIAKNI